MNKKFREYRMFCFCLVIFIVFSGVSVFCFLQKHPTQMIGALLLASVSLYLLLLRYKIIVFDDMMMIYEWKVAAMLPTMIEYKDIQSVEKKSKHRVLIHHKRESTVYVFDSDLFIETYESQKQK